MRLLFMTMLASVGTTVFGLLCPSPSVRLLRRGTGEQQSHCRHCGMNEITHAVRLCTYCYWNLLTSARDGFWRRNCNDWQKR